jgi:hypothetical protein
MLRRLHHQPDPETVLARALSDFAPSSEGASRTTGTTPERDGVDAASESDGSARARAADEASASKARLETPRAGLGEAPHSNTDDSAAALPRR